MFLEEVEDVTRLVDGLRSSKVSAEYVDLAREGRRDGEEGDAGERGEGTGGEDEASSEEKKTEVRKRVAEMMREKERRERARELYAKYQETLDRQWIRRRTAKNGDDGLHELGLVDALGRREDPWMTFTPGDNPAFKAMEADIDKERAAGPTRQTATARGAGNATFSGSVRGGAQDVREGLESDAVDRAARQRGDGGAEVRVLRADHRALRPRGELAEFFLEAPHPPAVKCLLRRARRRRARALRRGGRGPGEGRQLDPDDGEIVKKPPPRGAGGRTRQSARSRGASGTRGLVSRAGGADGDGAGSEEDAFAQVVHLEKLMRRVGGSGVVGG